MMTATKERPATYLAPKSERDVTGLTPCRYCGFALREHITVSTRPHRLGCPDRWNADRTWKGVNA